MTVDNIISLARTLTQSTTSQVDATTGLQFLNIVYHDLASRIISNDEDYFWNTFTADTVANQNEYKLPIPDATNSGIKKLNRVELKYKDTDTYKTLVSSDTLSNYSNVDDYIQANQSSTNAFYEVKDGSIFVYPKPTEAVTGGIKLFGTVTLIDLVSGGAETTVFPNNQELREFHNVLAIGMKQYIYGLKGKDGEMNNAINEYELAANRVLTFIQNRETAPVVAELPSTSLGY